MVDNLILIFSIFVLFYILFTFYILYRIIRNYFQHRNRIIIDNHLQYRNNNNRNNTEIISDFSKNEIIENIENS